MEHDLTPRSARPTPRVVQAAVSTPWGIDPGKLAYIGELLAARSRGFAPSQTEVQFALDGRARDRQADRPYQIVDGVAVIPLYGVLAPRMNLMLQFSGGTSTQQFTEAIDQAAEDRAAREIIIDADSPGGAVVGTQEAFDAVMAARMRKPVTAVGTNQVASCAYWICSAATRFVASPSCWAGAIGVYTLHIDQSRKDDKEGLKVTIVQRGKYKTDASPHKPLDAQSRQTLQEQVDASYTMMVDAIAAGRKVSVQEVEARFGQGKSFLAAAARQMGMVDQVATLKQILGELATSARDGMGNVPPRLAWLMRMQEKAQREGDAREAAAIASLIQSEKRGRP